MPQFECLRRWDKRDFSLICSFDGNEVILEDVHGRGCDANEIPDYVIDFAFGYIRDEHENGVSIEEIAKMCHLCVQKPRVVKESDLHSFEITIRYTCPKDFGHPANWDWNTLLDITPSMESIVVQTNSVEMTRNDFERWVKDTN